MSSGPSSPVDAREVRFEQAVLTLVLLTGFVFRVPWTVPAAAVLVALGLTPAVPFNPLRHAFDRWIGPRLRPPAPTDAATPSDAPTPSDRIDDLVALGVVTLASVLLVAGLDLVGWLVALVEAAASAVRATTGMPIVASLSERLGRRG